MFTVKDGLVLSPQAEKLFTKREWQRAFKAALIVAGRDFIAGALPKRFSKFAVDRLGYKAKKMDKKNLTREDKIKIALAFMRANGDRERIIKSATAPWGGWDPTAKEGPPADVFNRWYKQAVASRMIQPARDVAGWRIARQAMRKDVKDKARINERLRNYAIDEYVDADKGVEVIPLFNKGDLEKAALNNARPDAKTRGGSNTLDIRIPRPHATHRIVNETLKQSTPEEAQRVADITTAQMQAFIDGSREVPITSGKNKGTSKLKSTARQKRRITSLINGASVKSRAHKNRTPTNHKPRG